MPDRGRIPPRLSALLALASLPGVFAACVDEHESVVRTARRATEPWTCPETATQVERNTYGSYLLTGCGTRATYACNFATQPPSCWLERE